MSESRSLSLCVTTFNRDEMTYRAIAGAIDDDRISEIVIVDDLSNDSIYSSLAQLVSTIGKVKLHRNPTNLQCYRNKKNAISRASNEFVVIFDSDNCFSRGFVDAIYQQTWRRDTVLAPEWARPTFDYRHFAGQVITKQNVAGYLGLPRFDNLMNTMNYFVHRDEYIKIFEQSNLDGVTDLDPWTADTMYQNFNWLKAGNRIEVVRGLQYDHLVHRDSHYMKWVKRTKRAGLNRKDLSKQIFERLAQMA